MSQRDFTTALTQLLSDSSLRHEFKVDPACVADRLVDHAEDKTALLAITPSQLEEQAEGLVRKRAGEVSKLLPETWRLLGSAASEKFIAFADTVPWPEGHRRHMIDAVAFGEWLEERDDASLVRHELHRCRFAMSDARFGTYLIAHRTSPISARGICVLWRTGSRVRSKRIWLPLRPR